MIDKYKNKKAELAAWSKNTSDVIPKDLRWLCKVAAEIIGKLQTKLKKYRWIPVTEKLPKKDRDDTSKMVEVLNSKTDSVTSGYYGFLSGEWQTTLRTVTHWRYIILPQEEQL